MASGDKRPGVRGPRGPAGPAKGTPSGSSRPPAPRSSADLSPLQRVSLPVLTRLSALPKWLIVVVMASLLVLGMVQTGSLAWLGALILGLLALFFLWLLLLSWPVVPWSGRIMRLVVVVALAGVAYLKATGRI